MGFVYRLSTLSLAVRKESQPMSDRVVQDSPYERLGREAGVAQLIERFYELMDTLPEAATIRAMHASELSPMVEKLTVFLTGWMGGPERYRERFGRVIIPVAHEPFSIGSEERDQWLLCMRGALESVHAEHDLVDLLMPAFTQMAEMCRTRED
jgi:hemoglobin